MPNPYEKAEMISLEIRLLCRMERELLEQLLVCSFFVPKFICFEAHCCQLNQPKKGPHI